MTPPPGAVSPSERALAMTDENAPLDFTDETVAGEVPAFGALEGSSADVPPEVVSVSDLEVDDREDVLVVDEFVEDVDDEFEDVAEPSKPHGHSPQ